MSTRLFQPFTLRGLNVRNRLWVPPMCQYMVEDGDGVATDWHLVHYGSLARGGAGAIIIEATAVLPEGRITPNDLGLWDDAQVAALGRVTEFVHSQGAALGIQLAHAGRKASIYRDFNAPGTGSIPPSEGGWITVAPSPLPFPGYLSPRELDRAEIADVVSAFAAAAKRAVSAGLDFVEVHAAHGYLLHQFLSPLSNQRTDEFGGSLVNRSRLLLEVVDAIRNAVPDAMPLVVRLSATDWLEDGLRLDETCEVVALLREHGVDLADISSGGNARAHITVGPGYQVPLATTVKQRTGMPVAAVGRIDGALQAEQIILTGLADVVLSGRQFLRDPAFGLHAAVELGAELDAVPGPYRRAFRRPKP